MLRIGLFLNLFPEPLDIHPLSLPDRDPGWFLDGSWKVLGKYLCCFIWLLGSLIPLYAGWDEIPELASEQLQDRWLEQFYADLQEDKARLNAQSRFHFNPDNHNALFALVYEERALQALSNLYREDGAVPLAGFQLAFRHPEESRKQLAIGLMRCSWGLGSILGKSSGHTLNFAIRQAAHPAYASLQGVAGSFGRESFSAFLLATAQKRSARLNEAGITQLYKSRKNTISTVGEGIFAGGLEYKGKDTQAGLLGYHQSYGLAWADPNLEQRLWALSFFGGWNTNKHSLLGEVSLIGTHPALKLEAKATTAQVEQMLAFSWHKGQQLPAYAARASLLSAAGQRSELRYDLKYDPHPMWEIGISHALSRQNSALQNQSWMQRSIVALSFSPEDTSLMLQFTRLDKELLSQTDSTYSSTLPVHYRAQLKLGHRMSSALAWEMQFRYNYEEKLKTDNNSFYWMNALACALFMVLRTTSATVSMIRVRCLSRNGSGSPRDWRTAP